MVDNYLNSFDYAIVALYLATLVTLGFYLRGRASKSLENYLLGGRNSPWWLLGASGVMDFWDLSGTMIIVSFLYLLGPRGLFIEFRGGAVLVLTVIMLWTGKWHRRSGCLTAADWMIFRFGDGRAGRSAQLARALAGIVVTIGLIAYLVKGAGLFMSMFFPLSPMQSATIMIASAAVYTMLSGFFGVMIIHFLQLGVVLASAIVLISLAMSRTADVSSLAVLAEKVTGNPDWTAAAPTWRAVMPEGYKPYESMLLFALIYMLRNILFGMGAGDDPKYFAARTDADCGKLTLLWITLISLRWPMMIGVAVLGIGVVADQFHDSADPRRAVEIIREFHGVTDENWATVTAAIAHDPKSQPPELVSQLHKLLGDQWATKLLLVGPYGTINPERVMPAVVLLTIPPGLRALIVVSLIAASMAGFGAWANQSAGFFVHDIYQKYWRPTATIRELLLATWVFVALLASIGILFAWSATNINDVWAWITMGLGGGMMIPQLLPLYWKRFNGVGYTAGTACGVLAALAVRFATPYLPESWAIVVQENWLLPLLAVAGLMASVVATMLSPPTAEPVLRRFYFSTLPFGAWSPYPQLLPSNLRRLLQAEHRRDVLALPIALTYHVLIFMTPMLAVIRSWRSFSACLGMTLVALTALYFVWLRKIDEADANVAEARALLE